AAAPRPDDWTAVAAPPKPVFADPAASDGSDSKPGKPAQAIPASQSDTANANIRREPGLPDHEEVVRERPTTTPEFTFDDTEATDNDAAIQRRMQRLARQASLDPGDGIQL
ncbi:MAG: conjugal transfer protein TraG, partial [Sphingomonadaceae bacterium]